MNKLTPPTPVARKYFEQDKVKALAELAACQNGSWPRNLNDELRYSPPAKADTPAKVRRYVAKLASKEIAWLEAKLSRNQ